jgi:hypothetical protein
MRLLLLTAASVLGMCLTGCMTTRHVEQSRVVTTGVDPHAGVVYSDQATYAERNWHGPWVVQPDRVRP